MLVALEDLTALATGRPPALLVHCDVLVEVRLLGEGLAALGLGAHERTLTSVHPQVIEKVMPLSEEHSAATEVTFQQLHMPLGPWVFVFEDPELASRWDLLFNLNAREVKISAMLDLDSCSDRDLLPDSTLLNHVTANGDDVAVEALTV